MENFKHVLEEFHSWKPSKPIVIDSNISGITLDWKQNKFENNIIEKYFIYKLQFQSKTNGWIHFYSSGKTTKFFKNLQPSRQYNFRLKIILRPSYIERCVGETETNGEILNCDVENVSHDMVKNSRVREETKHADHPVRSDSSSIGTITVLEPTDFNENNVKKNNSLSCSIKREEIEENNAVSSDMSSKLIESLWSEEFQIFTESEGPSVLCFCMAVRCGYMKQVQVMLEQRKDLLSICNSNDGFTPLAIAVRKGNIAMVKFLINEGADVNQISTTTQTPIQLSAYHRHLEVSTLLLERGADIRISDRNGLNLLHYAVDSNDLNVVQFALTSGCDVSEVDNNGWTPLFRAVIQGADAALVQILVEKVSDLRHTDKKNLDLITYAKLLKSRDDIRRIVDKKFVHVKAFSNFAKLSNKISHVQFLASKSLDE